MKDLPVVSCKIQFLKYDSLSDIFLPVCAGLHSENKDIATIIYQIFDSHV